MLRESSIAHDYWQLLLKDIMQEKQDEFGREKKTRFKYKQQGVELHQQQEKLIELLEKKIDKSQDTAQKNNDSTLCYHATDV